MGEGQGQARRFFDGLVRRVGDPPTECGRRDACPTFHRKPSALKRNGLVCCNLNPHQRTILMVRGWLTNSLLLKSLNLFLSL